MSPIDDGAVPSGQPEVGAHRARLATRVWLWALVLVPVIAFTSTWTFMRPPPTNGPWSRWDLFSLADFVSWLLIAAATWALIGCVAGLIKLRDSEGKDAVFLCLIPALAMVVLIGWVSGPRCPDQIPRAQMLEPFPAGTQQVATERDDYRGGAELNVEVRNESGRAIGEMHDEAYAHYLALGWQRDPDHVGRLTAGEWELWITPTTSNAGSAGSLQLSLRNFDGACDLFD